MDRFGATDDRQARLTGYREERTDWHVRHARPGRHHAPQLAAHERYEPGTDPYAEDCRLPPSTRAWSVTTTWGPPSEVPGRGLPKTASA